MFVVIFGFILAFFWFGALRIKPESYPHVQPATILQWQYHRVLQYRRYAGLLLIQFLLELAYQFIGGWYERTHTQASLICAYIAVGIYLLFTLSLLAYMLINFIKMRRWQKAQGI